MDLHFFILHLLLRNQYFSYLFNVSAQFYSSFHFNFQLAEFFQVSSCRLSVRIFVPIFKLNRQFRQYQFFTLTRCCELNQSRTFLSV